MVEIFHQGIATNDDNDTAPENVPKHSDTTDGTGNWKRDSIICPQKAGNLQNHFASFRHYSHEAVLSISMLQFFYIIFPEDYIEKVLIPDTNNRMSVPMYRQEFI